MEKKADEAFNRLHPGSAVRRAAERPANDFDSAADERYVTPLTGTYARARDAYGALRARDRDLWPSGEPEAIEAE